MRVNETFVIVEPSQGTLRQRRRPTGRSPEALECAAAAHRGASEYLHRNSETANMAYTYTNDATTAKQSATGRRMLPKLPTITCAHPAMARHLTQQTPNIQQHAHA